jgi:hypothetical protein
MGPIKSDNNKWLIPLTMNTLSSFNCTYMALDGGTHALHGSNSPPPPPPPSLASPHLNLRDLVFNFIKIIVFAPLSFFLLRIFFSWTKSFIDIDLCVRPFV